MLDGHTEHRTAITALEPYNTGRLHMYVSVTGRLYMYGSAGGAHKSMEAYALLVSAALHKAIKPYSSAHWRHAHAQTDIHVHVHVRSYSGYEIRVEMFTQP